MSCSSITCFIKKIYIAQSANQFAVLVLVQCPETDQNSDICIVDSISDAFYGAKKETYEIKLTYMFK